VGIAGYLGVTRITEFEVAVKQTSLIHSVEKRFISDLSRFVAVQLHNFGTIDDFDFVVTGDRISEHWLSLFEGKGTQVVIVK